VGKEDIVVSELGGSQISTLLETLPGIANVLRSPVADALSSVIRAAARVSEFEVADAEELVRYATRRSLLGTEEGDRILAEVHAAQQKRLDKAADRERAQRAKAKTKTKAVKRVKVAKAIKKSAKGRRKR
jgi:Asp-tRNA(Asn)/Glu-tRNA(Gln) amidotransferase C subunit